MSLVRKGTYEGKPVIALAEDHSASWPRPFSFGSAKAALLVRAMASNPKQFISDLIEIAGDRVDAETANKLKSSIK